MTLENLEIPFANCEGRSKATAQDGQRTVSQNKGHSKSGPPNDRERRSFMLEAFDDLLQ